MTTRLASIAAALALSFGAASPVLAQDVPTFNAWGHTFNVPGGRPVTTEPGASGASGAYTAMTTGSVSPRDAGPAYRYSGSHAGGPANDLRRN